MNKELGEFEGKQVRQAVATFSGRVGANVGAFSQGEAAIIIAKVEASEINHKDFKAGTGKDSARLFSRVQKFTTTRAVVVDEATGARLLEEAIQLGDEQFGIQSLFSEVASPPDEPEAA